MDKSISKTIDYVEIPSREFFTALLGWKFTDYGPAYTSFADGRLTGGFYKSKKISLTRNGGTLPVIYMKKLEKAQADAVRLGAKLTKKIYSFPGGRRFEFTEPGGSEFAIWSDK